MSAHLSSSVSRLVILAALLASSVGCGPRDVERYRVQGVVSYEGRAIPQGTISFTTTREGKKYSGYAGIVNGRFDSYSDGKGHVGGEQTLLVIGGDTPTASEAGGEPTATATIGPVEWTEVFPSADVTLQLKLPK